MLHFETIWNEAESVAKSFTNLSRKEILKDLRAAVEGLSDSDSLAEYNDSMGGTLFALCALCAHLAEKKGIELNSAAALKQAIAAQRAKVAMNRATEIGIESQRLAIQAELERDK